MGWYWPLVSLSAEVRRCQGGCSCPEKAAAVAAVGSLDASGSMRTTSGSMLPCCQVWIWCIVIGAVELGVDSPLVSVERGRFAFLIGPV
jgi:hypothetical protein